VYIFIQPFDNGGRMGTKISNKGHEGSMRKRQSFDPAPETLLAGVEYNINNK
jgi:hypothetical protein